MKFSVNPYYEPLSRFMISHRLSIVCTSDFGHLMFHRIFRKGKSFEIYRIDKTSLTL